MKKLLLISCFATLLMAQGTIGGVTYFDFTYEDSTAFNFNRQYFSYGIDVSEDVQFNLVFDVGRTDLGTIEFVNDEGVLEEKNEDSRLVVFLKKAQLDYTCSWGKSSLGLIGTNTYGVQEKNWGYRFIEKSAIDKNGFSSTADMGLGFSRNFMDQLNLSLQIVNGEGFKSAQTDKYQKISLNTTYGVRNLTMNDGFNAGIVYTTEETVSTANTMTSLFGGFAGKGIRLGAEFDIQSKGNIESQLISGSANYKVLEKVNAFLRYDIYDPNTDSIVSKDEEKTLLAGVVLNCGSGLSVGPHIKMVDSFNDEEKAQTDMTYKISFQFKF